MPRTFNAKVFGGGKSPFNRNLVRKPSYQKKEIDPVEKRVIIDPPRWIKLGIQLDPFDGSEIGDFYLPFDSREFETSCLVTGLSGSGKSVLLARIHSELAFKYGRSQFIIDFKNQYKNAGMPNSDPNHVKILKKHGEKPMGVGQVKCFLPAHIIDRWGNEFCKTQYQYTDIWKLKTNDCDTAGLLMLGQKDIEGKNFVTVLDAALAVVRREYGELTIDQINDELETMKMEKSANKRSCEAIISMMDGLVKLNLIADDGNSILDLMHPPKKREPGSFFIFNISGSTPDDHKTKGMLINIMNGISQTLKTRLDVEPCIGIEEASTFFSKKSSPHMLNAFNQLQFVVGRTEGIFRVYVYQKKEQIPDLLFNDDGVSIIINTIKNFRLGNGKQLFGAGYAQIKIRNTTFMADDIFLVRVLPPKCTIIS